MSPKQKASKKAHPTHQAFPYLFLIARQSTQAHVDPYSGTQSDPEKAKNSLSPIINGVPIMAFGVQKKIRPKNAVSAISNGLKRLIRMAFIRPITWYKSFFC